MATRKRINTKGEGFKSRKPIKKRLKITKSSTEEELKEIKSKKIAFIQAYKKEGATISKALKKSGIKSQQTIYEFMDDDPIFREQYYDLRRQKDPISFYKDEKKRAKEEVEKPLKIEDTQDVKILKDAVIDAYRFSDFNLTTACEQVGIQRQQVVRWLQTDEDFKARLEDIDEEKKDLIESSLLQKVAAGDIAAIIFASKCMLRDRGYVEQVAPQQVNARIDIVHSKEEADAVIEAAQITTSSIAHLPAGKLLEEKINSTGIKDE